MKYKITNKLLNETLYYSTYEWQTKDDIKKLLTGTIEINNSKYEIKAYFRGKYYGYDLYVRDISYGTWYNLGEYETLKTKKSIIKELLIYFNEVLKEEEEEEEEE